MTGQALREVWKFEVLPIRSGSTFAHEMPEGAEILHVGAQGQDAFLWAKVDPDAGRETRVFLLAMTGEPFDDADARYLGTFHVSAPNLPSGEFVGHIFEASE